MRYVKPATFVRKIVFIFAIFQMDIDTFAPREAVRIRPIFEVDSVKVIGDICRCEWTNGCREEKQEWQHEEFH